LAGVMEIVTKRKPGAQPGHSVSLETRRKLSEIHTKSASPYDKASDTDWAWAAGLFEGEGNIHKFQNKGGMGLHLRLRVSSTDRDVLDHLVSIAGGGYTGPYHMDNPRHKPIWLWSLNRQNDVLKVMSHFYPYLGERRRARWDEVIGLRNKAIECLESQSG
jgi:hypothetical protein